MSNQEDELFEELVVKISKWFYEAMLEERKQDPNAAENELDRFMELASFLKGLKETGLHTKPLNEWTNEDCNNLADHSLCHLRLLLHKATIGVSPEVREMILKDSLNEENRKEYFRNMIQVLQGKMAEC